MHRQKDLVTSAMRLMFDLIKGPLAKGHASAKIRNKLHKIHPIIVR
jgi:hypothetical protein